MIEVFGVRSRESVSFPRSDIDGGSIVAARNLGSLWTRMREVKNSLLSAQARPYDIVNGYAVEFRFNV
jgi:hypothetical protein